MEYEIIDTHGHGQFAHFLPTIFPGKTLVRAHFETLESVADLIPDQKPNGLWHSSAWEHTFGFTGTTSMRQARSYALDGWQEGADRVREIADRIAVNRPHAPKLAKHAVAGATPNVPRYLAGNPLNMKTMEQRETAKRPVITLLADMAVSAMIDKDRLIRNAGICAAIVDRLEESGFRCEVLAGFRLGNDYGGMKTGAAPFISEAIWRAKEASAPMDASRLAFSVGHPSAFRRFGFALMGLNRKNKELTSGLGCPMHQHHLEKPPGVYVLPSAQNIPDDDMEAFKTTLKALHQQGCPGIKEMADAQDTHFEGLTTGPV